MHTKRLLPLLGLVLALSPLAVSSRALADSGTSFGLSPASGSYAVGADITVQVTETSDLGVNGVQLNLSYPTSQLTYESFANNGPFVNDCQGPTVSGGVFSYYCGINGSGGTPVTVTGAQDVFSLTFLVAAVGSGTAGVAIASGSGATGTGIFDPSGTNDWSGNLPSASYSLTTPTSSGGGGSSSSSSSSGGTTTTKTTPKTTTTTKTTTTPATTTTTTTPATTTTPTPTVTTPTVATPTTGTISVTILNSQGKPIADALVKLGMTDSTTTNSAGVATFSDIVSGSYVITASKSGEKSSTMTVSLAAGQDKVVSLKLSSASSTGLIIAIVAALILCLLIAGILYYRWSKRNKFPQPLPNNNDNNNFPPVTPLPPSEPITPVGSTIHPSNQPGSNPPSAPSIVAPPTIPGGRNSFDGFN
ncbi:MAG TPA: carboxypeptidase regulatory-like domain-containing protein [Candidatus Binatia bacterium]|nr:carboxypeptidase regulatory-like domain-containing protein [Candidatus Binatia bacterium]